MTLRTLSSFDGVVPRDDDSSDNEFRGREMERRLETIVESSVGAVPPKAEKNRTLDRARRLCFTPIADITENDVFVILITLYARFNAEYKIAGGISSEEFAQYSCVAPLKRYYKEITRAIQKGYGRGEALARLSKLSRQAPDPLDLANAAFTAVLDFFADEDGKWSNEPQKYRALELLLGIFTGLDLRGIAGAERRRLCGKILYIELMISRRVSEVHATEKRKEVTLIGGRLYSYIGVILAHIVLTTGGCVSSDFRSLCTEGIDVCSGAFREFFADWWRMGKALVVLLYEQRRCATASFGSIVLEEAFFYYKNCQVLLCILCNWLSASGCGSYDSFRADLPSSDTSTEASIASLDVESCTDSSDAARAFCYLTTLSKIIGLLMVQWTKAWRNVYRNGDARVALLPMVLDVSLYSIVDPIMGPATVISSDTVI